MKRHMDLAEVLCGIIPEKELDRLCAISGFRAQEWELVVSNYSPATPAKITSFVDTSYPAEPCEYEIDPDPYEAASRIMQFIIPIMSTTYISPRYFLPMWAAIYTEESKWQQENLDAEVDRELRGFGLHDENAADDRRDMMMEMEADDE